MNLREKFEKLNDNSSLNEIQEYIKAMMIQREFDKEDIKDEMILLTEEVGELAKAVRKTTNLKMDIAKENDKYDLKGELSDVFNYVVCMCCILDISLFDCYKEKEKRNFDRTWK